jgi:hypothetical protein
LIDTTFIAWITLVVKSSMLLLRATEAPKHKERRQRAQLHSEKAELRKHGILNAKSAVSFFNQLQV